MEKLGPGDPLRIGAYRPLARLGAGGMGHVYLARSERGRTVAVKLVRPELAAQEEFRARFRQEVEAARKVGGHWTAPVLDADTEAPVPWVATGYVAGPSLQQVVGHDHGALPERSVRILAAGLAHALKDIHAAGIVHRDLKPSNVLVTIDGPRVIDFGIARALETASGDGLTRTGSLVGSPGFMAPEQVRGDRVTAACDVFCLGSVLAYAATGVLPFGGSDSGVHAVMFRIAQEEPDLEGVPEGIADLVRQCLRKSPAARPTLDHILEHTGAEDTVSDGRSHDPWLPSALVAQLGRHAVRLLDTETPTSTPADPTPPTPTAVAPGSIPPHRSVQGTPGTPPHRPAPPGSIPPRPSAPSPADGGFAPQGPPALADEARTGGAGVNPNPVGGRVPTHTPAPAPVYRTPPPYVAAYPPPPYHQYGLPHAQPRERGNARSTVLLIVVALVVALGAGGSVYALMQHGDDHGAGGPTSSTSPRATTPAPKNGVIPESYLGTWSTTIDGTDGTSTRRLTITQGHVGDTVLTLVADGPTEGGGSYHCVFEATLAERPGGDGPLEIGPSTVSSGEPASSCSPGEATEVTLLPEGKLKRAKRSGGESLTYGRQ
ncbi:serine/threonine-protein kinase [Streptomyces sp. NPDC002520]